MSEPGKYVLLKKVQPSSKNIKKAEKQKNKKLKKKLQKEQQKKAASEIPQRNGKDRQLTKASIGKKKKKPKQKNQKGNALEKFNVPSKKNTATNKDSQQQSGAKTKNQNTDRGTPSQSPKKTFGDDLSDRLKASRFRYINEQLYTQTGEQAIEVFKEDSSAFLAYHDGYRKQIEQWPINPLDRIIRSIKKL